MNPHYKPHNSLATNEFSHHSLKTTHPPIVLNKMSSQTTAPATASAAEPPSFRRFDIATDYSDHHYAKSNSSGTSIGTEVSKKIMKEWKILEKNLPDSILVRTYESRIDLLRAVIIGPAGTPYHDGLFFFDLAFGSDYPNSPPAVYFHSYGLRLNPNLYDDGYVCLSLINTWEGKEEERWIPTVSTILQVLVSIQGLVLNEKPFFNEPELDPVGAEEGEIYSEAYNKEAYLFCCKMMMKLMQNPARNFEDFVRDYFRRRAEGILAACKAYSGGKIRVGRFNEMENWENFINVSDIFKKLMERTYRDLLAAFTNNSTALLCIN